MIKTCKVHGELDNAQVKQGIYRGKPYRKCKLCEQARGVEYHKRLYADEEKTRLKREKDKAYWEANKDKITERRQRPEARARRVASYSAYNARHKDYHANKQKQYKEQLHDTYIKKSIQAGNKAVKFNDIPQVMVKLKRALILLKRGIKTGQLNNLKEKLIND